MPVALQPGVAETLSVPDLLAESLANIVSFSPTTRLPGVVVAEPTSKRGAHPLRAICDFGEVPAFVRCSRMTSAALDGRAVGDLLSAASRQFGEIGMPGWMKRANELTAEIEGS